MGEIRELFGPIFILPTYPGYGKFIDPGAVFKFRGKLAFPLNYCYNLKIIWLGRRWRLEAPFVQVEFDR
jgi:hypothetical protein